MRNYFHRYKLFLLFLGKFFLSYLVLTAFYQIYLASYREGIDGITSNVAFLTQKIASVLGIELETKSDFLQYQIVYNGNYLARIIEGCNSVSVIILFNSFVIAFSNKVKPTLWYLCIGSFLIYGINILRIICLTVLLDKFPKQEHLLHGVFFPLGIYGFVFVLWIVWVTKIVKYASK